MTAPAPAIAANGAAAIAAALRCYRFRILDEDHLQSGLAGILDERGVRYQREAKLTGPDGNPLGRIDFLTETGIGIEVKVAGSHGDVYRQLVRYAPACSSLLLVTTRAAHRTLPMSAGGTVLHIAHLRAAL